MRLVLVVLAATAGVAAALAAAVLWTVGSDLLDEERFTERTLVALRAPEGRDAIAARVTDVVAGPAAGLVPEALVRRAVDPAVARVVRRPAFAAAATPSIVVAHRTLPELSGDPVELDLVVLRALVAGELARIDPRLAALLPPAGALDGVTIATGIDAPWVPAEQLEGRVPLVAALLALAAAALLGIALALAERPGRAAAAAGVALLAGAAVPAALRSALPAAAEARVAPPDGPLAHRLAEELLGGWLAASAVLAAAGLALVAGGLVATARGRRPPTRTPAG